MNLLTDKMIVYVGQSMRSAKELLQLINEFSMVSGYKDTLESALDCKIRPVNPKGNQSWISIGRTEAEASTLWPADVKSWLTGKDPDVGGKRSPPAPLEKTEGKRRMGWQRMRWFDSITHRMGMNLSKLQETVGTQSLVCYSPWGCKELDTR